MSMDLKYSHNINGNQFGPGEGVDTNAQMTDADGKVTKHDFGPELKEAEARMAEATEYAATHHGEVPTSDDPNEVTLQTPTRHLTDDPQKGDKN